MAGDSGLGDQARGDGDDTALGQLAAPPVCAQELHKLGLGVDAPIVCSGVGQHVLVEYSWELWSVPHLDIWMHIDVVLQGSETCRMAPDETTTTRDLDSTNFWRKRWVK